MRLPPSLSDIFYFLFLFFSCSSSFLILVRFTYVDGTGSAPVDIGTCFQNEFFGESSLLTAKPRRATATANGIGETVCYTISGRSFRLIFGEKLVNSAEASGEEKNAEATPAEAAPAETATAEAAATSFIVFEAESRRTTTSDSRGLLCGVEPYGSGDWDCTIKAKPKNADSADSPTYENDKNYKTLEDVMYLVGCDHQYVCPTGSCPVMSSSKGKPCACWQGKKNIPQNVDELCEFDGNSGEVGWETDTHVFEMEYATS